MPFQLGLAIWGYKGWVGGLFPPGSPSRDFLSLYSRRFVCVEGNTTFYAIPSVETIHRWTAQMPPEFRFCPKLPKLITHNGALLPQLTAGLKFLERMQEFGDRLGPLFIQLPPRYGPRQFDDLNQFLQGWTAAAPDCPIALEVRHIDWFKADQTQKLTAVLEDLGVGRVLLDSRPIYTGKASPLLDDLPMAQREKKPRVPLQPCVTADFAFVRYISHPALDHNQIYLTEWAAQIQAWLKQGKQIYFFVHCPVEAHSPQIARHLQAMLEAADGVPVPPLPWDQLPDATALEAPSQLSLFDA
ncbi:DUF72 domain-containing protein [filamentous cyanobacterium LEGE 11480]|uniref:DUF72 domain-containing protein n=1 Tax=Romeriopsis navalis LEGE 11480 TaxID=2777977 RepID=A0A928Z189_9CYAN|nr:DUF72 domain-containing protein [Romeriopsis navalis LEGE 11480]